MRVGVVGPVAEDYLAVNVAETLRHMGLDVVPLGPAVPDVKWRPARLAVDIAKMGSARFEARLERGIVDATVNGGCDVVISVDGRLSPAAVRMMRDRGVPVALWFPDAVSNLGNLSMFRAPYTAYFFKDPLLVQRLTDVYRLPAYYLPEACNPRWHHPVGVAGSDPHIVVVGNIYPTRVHLLEGLLQEGIPIRLHSGGKPRPVPGFRSTELPIGGFVAKEEKSRVFHEARAVLNNLHPAEMTSVNCRLYEAAAAGAVVLCEERPTLAESFIPGVEVASFDSFERLVELAKSALEEPDRFADMRVKATARAHADHTYELRLGELLDRLT